MFLHNYIALFVFFYYSVCQERKTSISYDGKTWCKYTKQSLPDQFIKKHKAKRISTYNKRLKTLKINHILFNKRE